MRKILLICIVVSCSLLNGCNKNDDNNDAKPTTYPQLSGAYQGARSVIVSSFAYRYNFDATVKASKTTWTWNTKNEEWDNKGTDIIEWKIEDNIFYEKLWNNQHSEFKSKSFEYKDSNTFLLDGITYIRE